MATSVLPLTLASYAAGKKSHAAFEEI